ncbi:MAG TPA: RecB-like helicase [Sulfuricurvum sp.]|nr:RecB-like helicase [Sulfuricurvum sp.]
MSQFEPFLAYEASAGSGKTFNLVVRYLSLLFMGEDPSSITALTFTNKAANEMMERVIETLKLLEERSELLEIERLTGISKEEILALRPKILGRFLRSDVHIATIDKFFGTILRKFALNAGIMPTYSAATAHHEIKFLERFLHEVEVANEMPTLAQLALLSSKRLNDIFILLSQLYAKHKEFEGIELPRAAYDNHGYAKAMALALELSALVLSKPLSERAAKTMQIENYESLLAKTWLYKPSLEYWDFKKIYEPKMDVLLREIQETVRSQMQAKEADFIAALFRLLRIYIKSRQALIRQNQELTFDDITLMVHSLLRGTLESEFLYFRLDSRMKHLLLDEFQDTSVIQFDILRPLIEEISAGKGINEGGSFFFVGDVKQSIYRFRGGVSALFYEVADHFEVQVRPLEVNYRSKQEVVAFVNRVFGAKMKRYIPQGSPASKKGGFVQVSYRDDPLKALQEQIDVLRNMGVAQDDIAILCVTNSDGSTLEEYLEEQGYDVVSEATSKLIHQRSVKALIEYLRYCYFRADIYRHNCAALLGVPSEAITAVAITDLQAQSITFIREHAIGDKSAMMFIEKLGGFRDIEELAYEIERLDASSPQSDLHGIRIMTVHKSKGLEFEHVLVLDRLGQGRNRGESIVYEYEGIHLSRLFYRIKGREELDAAYKRALEKEKVLEREDHLNALYVALTRAVQSLTIIAKPKSSWFEPLELAEGCWGEKAFETGAVPQAKILQSLDYQPVSYGRQDEVLTLKEHETVDYDAVQFGLAVHYALEMMGDFQNESIHHALESARKRYGASIGTEKIEAIRSLLHRLISDERFYALTRGRCYKEQRFFYKGEMRIIDLLVEHEAGHWVVIDYKTGQEMSPEHKAQVRLYKEAVQVLSGRDVIGYLCYLDHETVKWEECL